MIKKILTLLIFSTCLQSYGFEDYIIMTNGKLTDISIEDNTIVDVCPIVNIMNSKNSLMICPLKEGKTRFSMLKNKKEKIMFEIEISPNKTKISENKDFYMLSIDLPPVDELEIDLPPEPIKKIEPPKLRDKEVE